jgi:hypothetical protein
MGVQRAKYVKQALHDWGKDVFSNLFTTDQVCDVYDALAESSLSQRNRIEIHSDNPQILAWPWESFVRPSRLPGRTHDGRGTLL